MLATCVYQLNRLFRFRGRTASISPRDARDAEENKGTILAIVIGCVVAILVLAFLYSGITGYLMILFLLGLGYLYSVPTIGGQPKRRLKDLFIGKNLAPAVGTAATVCLYPAINAGRDPDFEVVALFAAVLGGSFLLEIICDVRDYSGDKRQNIQSDPGAARPR